MRIISKIHVSVTFLQNSEISNLFEYLTFLSGSAEYCVPVGDSEQSHVFVIDDELGILKPIVDADEISKTVALMLAKMSLHDDVKNLSGSFIISWVGGLTQWTSGAVQLPVDSLYGDEQRAYRLENCG